MSGEKKAIEMAVAQRGTGLEDEPEQVDFMASLGIASNDKVIALRAAQPKPAHRPQGSRNRRTLEMANYLLSRYTSPLEVLAQMATMPLSEMAAALGCTLHEAWQERRLAAIGLAPYVHQKMPIAVDVANHKIVHLVIGDLGAAAADAGKDGDTITLTGEILARTEAKE